jgi:hypothetical protein
MAIQKGRTNCSSYGWLAGWTDIKIFPNKLVCLIQFMSAEATPREVDACLQVGKPIIFLLLLVDFDLFHMLVGVFDHADVLPETPLKLLYHIPFGRDHIFRDLGI